MTLGSDIRLQEVGRQHWQAFQSTLLSINSSDVRVSGASFCPRGCEDGRNVYTYFPWLFLRTETRPDYNRMEDLSVAAIFLLWHASLVDSMIDREVVIAEGSKLFTSHKILLLAWQKFQSAQCADAFPWSEFVGVYFRWTGALERERVLNAEGPCSDEALIRLSAEKSWLAQIIVKAVCCLDRRTEPDRAGIQRSVDFFHLAANLSDDLQDWREDWAAGRDSYFIRKALRRAALGREGADRKDRETERRVAAAVFDSLDEYFAEIEAWVTKAILESVSTDCPRWLTLVTEWRETQLNYHSWIKAKMRKLLSTSSGRAEVPRMAPQDIGVCLGLAKRYLLGKIDPEYGIPDLWTAKGPCNILSTVTALSALQGLAAYGDDGRSTAEIDQLRSWLCSRCFGGCPDNMFSVHRVDTITTSLVVSALLASKAKLPAGALSAILSHQTAAGAFGRYAPERDRAFGDVDSTAAALGALVAAGEEWRPYAICAADYLQSCCAENGLWRPAWWLSLARVNYDATAALMASGVPMHAHNSQRARESLVAAQLANGSWPSLVTGKASAFETAWAIRLLLLLGGTASQSEDNIVRGVAWLLGRQHSDGGWPAKPLIRTDEEDSISRQMPVELFGIVGARRDSGRVLSTAAVIEGLLAYARAFLV